MNDPLEALRLQIGECRRRDRWHQAVVLGQQLVAGWQARGEGLSEANALLDLARDCLRDDQPRVSFACLARAESRYREAGRPDLLPTVQLLAADLYTQLHLPLQAIAVLEEVARFPETTAGQIAEHRLSMAYLHRGDLARARVFQERARRHYQQQGRLRDEGILLLTWGAAAQDRACLAESVTCLDRAAEVASAPAEKAPLLSARATALSVLGRNEDARQAYRDQLALCARAGLWSERFQALGAYASFLYFQGTTGGKAEARACLEAFRALAQQQESPDQERAALQKSLDFAVYDQDMAAVARTCTALIGLCLNQGWREALPAYQEQHARALSALGKRAEAAAACRVAISLLDQRRRTYGALPEASQALRQDTRAPYERFLSLLPETSPEVFPLVQQLKAQALHERRPTPPGPEEEALRGRCDSLNAALIAEGLRNAVGSKKRFAALQAELTQAERTLARFYDTLHARQPETALQHAVAAVSPATLQAALPDRTLVLDFVLPTDPREAPWVLAVRRDRTRLVRLTVPLAQLSDAIAALRQRCSKPGQPWEAAAATLADVLFSPLAHWLEGIDHLVICPDGVLWDIPFGVFFLERFTVTQAFSASLWHSLRVLPPLPPRPLPLLAVAAPQTPGEARPIVAPERPIVAPERPIVAPERSAYLPASLPPLPGALREVRALVRLFPGARCLENSDAQEEVLKRALPLCRRLHIAAHAFVNDTAPALSCLVLAEPQDPLRDDGFLTARELAALDLSGVDLATLSACNTARGQTLTGEGMRGLGWSLALAGVRNQVLSQWSVADDATVEWMQAFYGALLRGSAKPEALRHAALTQRRTPRRAHPYYWGAFLLLGSGL